MIASGISRGKLLVLPRDIKDYGIEPVDFEIARAVRMRMLIPLFFEPVTLRLRGEGRGCVIVDGGVLNNFPIQLLDDGIADPPWPTFGYLVAEDANVTRAEVSHEIFGQLSLIASIFFTMMGAHDLMHISNEAFVRTIMTPTVGVKTTEFDLAREKAVRLYQSGLTAGRQFFRTWDFEAYNTAFWERATKNRRETLFAAISQDGDDAGVG